MIAADWGEIKLQPVPVPGQLWIIPVPLAGLSEARHRVQAHASTHRDIT